jgi:DNA repair photolyase
LLCPKHKIYNKRKIFNCSSQKDPYNKLESELRLTRECLKIALKYKIPISILTKSKTVLNDLDIIKKFGENIKIGFTLTFDNDIDSIDWEKEASLPKERVECLKVLKENNIKTWIILY